MKVGIHGALFFAFASTILGCTCVGNGSYCSVIGSTEIVFVGRVIEDSGEGFGKGPARMIVEEVLHGLPKEVRELTVDTSAGTSCYMRLQKDERYVIYGSAVAGEKNHVRRNACSFSFALRGNEFLLAALRDQEAKTASALVGKVRVKHFEYDVSGEGAAGVTVTAIGSNVTLKSRTNADGEFEFRNIAPGTYHLDISDETFFLDSWKFPSDDPRIASRSCGHQELFVWPNGRIEGMVLNQDGSPLTGVPVQAFMKDQRGEFDSGPLREAKTDDSGHYTLQGLPPGEFIVGINGETYDDRQPWRPTFYPAPADRNSAGSLTLDRGQHITGIDLQAPPPRRPATLHIEAVLDDGTTVTDIGANVENLAGVQRAFFAGFRESLNEKSQAPEVKVFIGETYIVRCHRYRDANAWTGTSVPIHVSDENVHVRVVLHPDEKLNHRP
jgi:hypothetical protein